jgi:diguanylate cyclase (GGDEF)-like protein/PAS domain S-box-containing protein
LRIHNREGAHYSVPLKKSLRFRLAFVNAAAAVLLGAVVLGIVYNVLERRMETEYVAKGKAVAATVACVIDAESVDRYLSALERDAEYEATLFHLRTMQREHGLLYVCVIRMAEDGEVIVFDSGEAEEGPPELGVFLSWVDSFGEGHDDYIKALLLGERVGPLISNGVYGHILSAYEPIYRGDGSVAAYACVDISMEQIKRDGTVMFVLAGCGVMSVLVLVIAASHFTFRRYILSPVSILLDQSESVHAAGSGSAKEAPLQPRLRYGDELAVLERAIIDMETRIRAEVAERLRVGDAAQTEAEYHAKVTGTLNNMAIILLSQRGEKFDSAMTSGIGLVADMMDLDRVTVWRNIMKPDGLYGGQVFRWDRKDGGTTPTAAQFGEIKVSEWMPRWEYVLSAGETINGPASMLPEAAQLQAFDCVSIYISPIITNKEFLGYVMFEDRSRERVFTDGEAEILQTASLMISSTVTTYEEAEKARKAEERVKLMLDATPFGCQIIDHNLTTIDCNEAVVKLFGFGNKQEFIERWLLECSPEYQPDGQRSDEKRFMVMKKAIEEGGCAFEWMHQKPDGTPLPAEITLTRVEYENSFVLLGCTRDLREIKEMAENVLYLKTEAEKIFIDPLTEIYNRRYLDENLKRVISSLSRSDAALSLMMIDIDHFKKYNDTYGHAKGDDCLKTVAATLKNSLTRADDFVVRYGGEEFAVVLPNTDRSGARLIAAKLLKNIQDRAIPHETSDVAAHVTVSIGVTSGAVRHTHSADYWLRLADEMLYKSKQEGRNRYNFKAAGGGR